MDTKNRKPDRDECEMLEKERPLAHITAVQEKIGESRDNLAGRARWFSRRSGEKKKS